MLEDISQQRDRAVRACAQYTEEAAQIAIGVKFEVELWRESESIDADCKESVVTRSVTATCRADYVGYRMAGYAPAAPAPAPKPKTQDEAQDGEAQEADQESLMGDVTLSEEEN